MGPQAVITHDDDVPQMAAKAYYMSSLINEQLYLSGNGHLHSTDMKHTIYCIVFCEILSVLLWFIWFIWFTSLFMYSYNYLCIHAQMAFRVSKEYPNVIEKDSKSIRAVILIDAGRVGCFLTITKHNRAIKHEQCPYIFGCNVSDIGALCCAG